MTTPLRDYTKIEEKNCQLVTHYGGKKFNYPHDVTTGPNNEVVIADRENKEVIILDQEYKLIRRFGRGSGDSKLNCPRGVAVGHHVIVVSEFRDDVVKKYSLQGDYLSKFGSRGSGNGQFNEPRGLCFNSKGLLYVVDCRNHRVQVFRENVFLFTFGSEGHNPGQFQSPRHIAVDSSDQVYVTDHESDGGIHVFSEDGHFIKKINCYYPHCISIAPDGYIITDDPSDVLTVISPTHELVAKLGVRGNGRGQFNSIIGIAINSSGTIIVAESRNHRLQIITS